MIIGIDIGGTKCAVVAADDQGNMGRVIRFPTTNVHDTLAAIFAAVHDLRPDGQQTFGIACGGPLDAKAGVVLSPPNLPDWDRIAICQLLQERFGGRAYRTVIGYQMAAAMLGASLFPGLVGLAASRFGLELLGPAVGAFIVALATLIAAPDARTRVL